LLQTIERMDATKATQIRLLILEAADAIERAHAIVSTLDSDDQALLAASLDEISLAIHARLLQQLYLGLPGLKEEGEGWNGTMA
jgi:hypothetical protein